ncbi:MAG: imidazoleglycerol-phosphate dehydratase HisB [Verrucomicrobiota bacterium]
MAARTAQIERNTAETRISMSLDVDGTGKGTIDTGIPFLDHMLTLFSRHGMVDLEVKATGDIDVDYHHTVEDTGIVLGQCLAQALGEKRGIHRYGWAYLPMDETLARVVVDLSGRSFLEYRAPTQTDPIRDFPFQLVEEFMRGLTNHLAANVHIEILYGRDSHHMAEAIFKGLARALDQACQLDTRRGDQLPTTKESW